VHNGVTSINNSLCNRKFGVISSELLFPEHFCNYIRTCLSAGTKAFKLGGQSFLLILALEKHAVHNGVQA